MSAGLSQTGSNQLNIGNLIFGSGLSSGSTFSTGGIGIGTSTDPWGNALTAGLTLGYNKTNGTNLAMPLVFYSATSTSNVATSSNALYNVNGSLYWNGSALGQNITSLGWDALCGSCERDSK